MTDKVHLGHRARKRFGQNFLNDDMIIDKIVTAIDPKPEDNLVEIGPGLGAITEPVADLSGHLTVVELDKDLAEPYFEQNLTQQHGARKVVISVADFGAAAVLCHHSEYLLTCSKAWARQSLQAKGLIEKPLPFDYGQVAYSLVWNQASLNDPALNWLYNQWVDS